jgi:hypothetical protein
MLLLIAGELSAAGQAPSAPSSPLRSVEIKQWNFPYKNGTFEITYSREADGTGALALWMAGPGPNPGSLAQAPFIETALKDMQSAGYDPSTLRHMGFRIASYDDLRPLAIACVHSSDCPRTTARQKGALSLVINLLNEQNILSAYQDVLAPYGLTSTVCDADNLFTTEFKAYGVNSPSGKMFADSLVPASVVVTLCLRPKTQQGPPA